MLLVWNLLHLNLTLQLITFFMHWASLCCLSGLTAFKNECVLYSHSALLRNKIPWCFSCETSPSILIRGSYCDLSVFSELQGLTIFRFAFLLFFTANIVPCSVKICHYYYHYCVFYFHLSFRKIKELTLHGATPIGDVQGVKSFLSLLPHTPTIPS